MSGLGSTPRNESVSEVWVKFCDDVMLTVFDGIPNDVMAKAKYIPAVKQWEWRSPEGARMRLVREPLYSVRQGRVTGPAEGGTDAHG